MRSVELRFSLLSAFALLLSGLLPRELATSLRSSVIIVVCTIPVQSRDIIKVRLDTHLPVR